MTTLADIVVANPAAARVFEVHAIDYCCHGQRPLEQACAEAGIDPAVVQGEIDRLAAGIARLLHLRIVRAPGARD